MAAIKRTENKPKLNIHYLTETMYKAIDKTSSDFDKTAIYMTPQTVGSSGTSVKIVTWGKEE